MAACELRISGKNKSLRRWEHYLTGKGFLLTQNKYTQTWKRTFAQHEFSELNAIKKKFRWKKGITCEIIDANYTRDNVYRKRFFENTKPFKNGKYRCIYCGRKFSKSRITVDHIYPINAARTKKKQFILKLFGINNINDVKNLGAACMRCNKKKSDKTGLWVLRGLLGRSEIFWLIYNIFRLIFLILLCIVVFYAINNQIYLDILPNL